MAIYQNKFSAGYKKAHRSRGGLHLLNWLDYLLCCSQVWTGEEGRVKTRQMQFSGQLSISRQRRYGIFDDRPYMYNTKHSFYFSIGSGVLSQPSIPTCHRPSLFLTNSTSPYCLTFSSVPSTCSATRLPAEYPPVTFASFGHR